MRGLKSSCVVKEVGHRNSISGKLTESKSWPTVTKAEKLSWAGAALHRAVQLLGYESFFI